MSWVLKIQKTEAHSNRFEDIILLNFYFIIYRSAYFLKSHHFWKVFSSHIPVHQRFSTCCPRTSACWSATKGYFLFFRDKNTYKGKGQFWQFSISRFSVVVCERETNF